MRPPPTSTLFPYTTLFRSFPTMTVSITDEVELEELGSSTPMSFTLHAPADKVKNLLGEFKEILRSEEHTSELQSRLHLVCRLLLEKKKNLRRFFSISDLIF